MHESEQVRLPVGAVRLDLLHASRSAMSVRYHLVQHHRGMPSDFWAIFIIDAITLVFTFTHSSRNETVHAFPRGSAVDVIRRPGLQGQRKLTGEGEFGRNVGRDRTLSLLCIGRRVSPHAPKDQGLLHLPELWSSHQPRPVVREVCLPEMPKDGCDRAPLPW